MHFRCASNKCNYISSEIIKCHEHDLTKAVYGSISDREIFQNSNKTGSGGIPKNITLTDLEIFPREPSFSYTVSKLFLNFLVCEELYF